MDVAALSIALETRLKGFMLALSFDAGNELLALVGRSGSGKSVVLRSIAGVYIPDAGTISIRDETVFSSGLGVNVPPAERHVGFVPETHALFEHLTVAENVRFPLTRGQPGGPVDSAQAERRVGELLELLNLREVADVIPEDLNPVERQRAALARALALDPEVVLIDDSFAPLDMSSRRQARVELAELRRLINVPVILATSELEEAYEIADRIALLDQGDLLQIAPPRQLLMRPANRRVAELVRSVNVIPGAVIAEADEGIDVTTPLGILRVSDLSGIHGEVDVVVRPEHVRLLARNETIDDTPATNILHGVIASEERHGALHALTFRPDDAYHDTTLHILVSDLAYQQLGLAAEQHRSVVLPPRALHLMPRNGEDATQPPR